MKKEIFKTYKYRIYPKKNQVELLEKHFGCVRFVYNRFLFEKQKQYKETGKSDSFFEQKRNLTRLKQDQEFQWLKEVNSQSLQSSLRNLDRAYKNFFQGRSKYPIFKKKHNRNSFEIPQNVKFENSKLYIPKFREGIKVVESRPLPGKILFATISKTPTKKYFISIVVQQEYNSKTPTNKEVGIDLGIKNLVITSDGKKYENHKYTQKYAKKLRNAQKHLSRKKKGSHQFEKQRLKVAKIHEKITNCRSDVIHKITHELVMKNDCVFLENLNVSGMLKNKRLAKSISDCSWSELKRQLEYKGDWEDVLIHEIDRFFPSSKTCSFCGYKVSEMPLSIRFWVCPNCGKEHDRDINASKNILRIGKQEISVGTTDYTNGEEVRPNV